MASQGPEPSVEESLRRCTAELIDTQRQLGQTEQRLDGSTSIITNLRTRVSELEQVRRTLEVKGLAEKNKGLCARVEELEAKLVGWHGVACEDAGALAKAEARVEELEGEVKQLEAEQLEYEDEIATVEAERDRLAAVVEQAVSLCREAGEVGRRRSDEAEVGTAHCVATDAMGALGEQLAREIEALGVGEV